MRKGTLASAVLLASMAAPAWADEIDAAPLGLPFADDTEYRANGSNAAVKAGDAHLRGWTGAGQTLAVFDSGLDPHPEFAGRILTGWDAVLGAEGVTADANGHGTFVAGVAAAARDGFGMQGIAYDASLMSVRIADERGFLSLPDANLAAGIRYAIGKAGVFNNSWNSAVTVHQVSPAAFEAAFGQSLAAWREAVAGAAIVVFAAGNQGMADPGVFGALPAWYADLQPGWIVAVATDPDGAIAGWSNRCGGAAAWCLAAPGSQVVSTYGESQYAIGAGTSFAAPVVSGGALLLKQQWPHLTNGEITAILFQTADKSGIYADPAVYGQGMLDLEAATRPVGTVGIATGSTTATTAPVDGSMLVTSAAFGQSIRLKGAGASVMVLDGYARDYYVPVGAFVVPTVTAYDLEEGLDRLGAGLEIAAADDSFYLAFSGSDRFTSLGLPRYVMRLAGDDGRQMTTMIGVNPVHLFGGIAADLDAAGLLPEAEAVGSAYLGLAGGDVSGAAWTVPMGRFDVTVAAFHGMQADRPAEWSLDAGDPTRDPSTASVVGMVGRLGTAFAGVRVGMHAGLAHESGTVLGSAADGAFALGSAADTVFTGLTAETDIGRGISLFGGAEIGRTNAGGADGSLVAGLDDVTTTAFHLGIARQGILGETDRASFVVSQPLRAGGGRVDFNLPAARDLDGNVRYVQASQDVAADGREIDFQLGYSTALGIGESLTAATLLRLQPDNVRSAEPEAVAMMKYRLEF